MFYPIGFTIFKPRVDANERPCNPRRACKKYLNRLLSSDPATAADMHVRTCVLARSSFGTVVFIML